MHKTHALSRSDPPSTEETKKTNLMMVILDTSFHPKNVFATYCYNSLLGTNKVSEHPERDYGLEFIYGDDDDSPVKLLYVFRWQSG